MRRPPATETIQVPHEYMAFADARIADVVRRCLYDQNIVESVSRSCYLQGLCDGAQLVRLKPGLLDQITGESPAADPQAKPAAKVKEDGHVA